MGNNARANTHYHPGFTTTPPNRNDGDRMSQPQLNDLRINILKLIEHYKFLTTSQIIRELDGHHPMRSVQHALTRLKQLEMISGQPIEPERGHASELYWQLRPAGAKQIGVVHNSHYTRRPTRERIVYRSSELELGHQAKQANWQLITPTTHSPTQPLPDVTNQHIYITEAARFAEYYQIAKYQKTDPNHPELPNRIERFNKELYKGWTPARVNDFVAFYQTEPPTPNNFLAVVLIPCPPDITERFWAKRIEQYQKVARSYKSVWSVQGRDPSQHT